MLKKKQFVSSELVYLNMMMNISKMNMNMLAKLQHIRAMKNQVYYEAD